MKYLYTTMLILLFFIFVLGNCTVPERGTVIFSNKNEKVYPHPIAEWTFMIYSDADNNLEQALLNDIQEMKQGFDRTTDAYLIVLIDRIPSWSFDSSVLGENFTDTRLYRITKNKATRIGGGDVFPEISTTSNYEANMGDPNTLKKFIQYCKTIYPAKHYALILENHGSGVRDRSESIGASFSSGMGNTEISEAICWDDTNNGDTMFTAEITDVLTENESVDLIGFDACLMSSIEVAYQFRPGIVEFSANVMVASAPNEWGAGWQYENIFNRLKNGGGSNGQTAQIVGGNELYYVPSALTATILGGIIVEEYYDSTSSENNQSLSAIDLTKVQMVKNKVDSLSIKLMTEKTDFENLRGSTDHPSILYYFDNTSDTSWLNYPFADLYDLSYSIYEASDDFNSAIASDALLLFNYVDELVLYSFAGSDFSGFKNGKCGISIFCPDGDKSFYSSIYWPYILSVFWHYQYWYNSIDTSFIDSSNSYGKQQWCIDNATAGDSTVKNWFELLDSWFDNTNDASGGYNYYQW